MMLVNSVKFSFSIMTDSKESLGENRH